MISCPFKFPNGDKCGGDHHIKFCWAKQPELCRLPKVRAAIEHRLGKNPSGHRAVADSDSEDDDVGEDGHHVLVESYMCYSFSVPKPALCDQTEGLIDLPAYRATRRPITPNELLVDSGASDHIIIDRNCITRPEQHNRSLRIRVRTGNDTTSVTSIGPATFVLLDANAQSVEITRKVLFIEKGFSVNLFSVPLEYDMYGTTTRFEPNNDLTLDDGTVVPFHRDAARKYVLPYKAPSTPAHAIRLVESSESNSLTHLWHRRMGHCSPAVLAHLPSCLLGVQLEPSDRKSLEQIARNCLVCPMAKMKEDPHPNNRIEKIKGSPRREKLHRDKIHTQFGKRVLMDLAGPLTPSYHRGYRYVSLFLDDGTDAPFVYFLCHKHDQKDQHMVFVTDTAEYGDVEHYHSDNGGEYTDKQYLRNILEEGAKRTFAVSYTPNLNNKAENTFWRLFCIARALLFESGLPQGHWPYALQHAAYLLMRTPMKRIEQGQTVWKTPYERLKNRLPHTRHIKVWGCQVSAVRPKQLRANDENPKLSARAELAYFMGRSPDRKAFIVFIPKPGVHSLAIGTYRERRTVLFHEDVTPRRIREGLVRGFPLVPKGVPLKHPITPRNGSEDDDDEDAAEPVAPTATAPAPPRDPCRQPGCTFRFGHDGAHSNELTPGRRLNTRPSDNLRTRPGRSPRALTAGVGGPDTATLDTATVTLESGAKIIWANKTSRFDLNDMSPPTNLFDAEDIATAINQDNPTEIHALVAKQKMFRNESDGTYETRTVPKNLKEVLKSSDKESWIAAMWEELRSHLQNGTWELVPADSVPAKRRRVGSTWAFDIKRDASGKVIRWKARLCAQGFTQEEGVDYFNTYSNTIRYDTLRLILALAALHNLHLTSIDIKTAYLNGFIEADINIYMSPPRGFSFKVPPADGAPTFTNSFEYDKNYACLLKRSIYGLKQSGRCWETRFWERLKELGAKQSDIDPCLWILRANGNVLLIGIYVDDVVFACNSPRFRDDFVAELAKSFHISDQGQLTWIFGTAIRQDLNTGTVQLNQSLYIEDLVHRYAPAPRKGRVIPCPTDITDLVPGKEDELLHPQYRAIIGQLLWISIISRPDISYAVSFLSRFCTSGTQVHYEAAVGVVGYLMVTKDKAITYTRESPVSLIEHLLAHSELKEFIFDKNTVITFTDASHGGERPMAGFVGMLAGGPISWAAYRLPLTPLSVCQGEYHAATRAAVMCKAHNDSMLFLGFSTKGASPIFCDNRATILLSDAGISIKKLRHVATHIAFLRELVNSEDIMLLHIGTKGQIADICTKPLAAAIFHELRMFLV